MVLLSPCNKDKEEKFVGSKRDSLGVLCDPQAQQEHDYRRDVTHVTAQAKYVHGAASSLTVTWPKLELNAPGARLFG